MELQTRQLRIVLQTPEEVEAMIEAMSDDVKAQVSPHWLAQMRAAKVASPWTHAFRMVHRDTDASVGSCSFKGPPLDGIVEIAYGVNPEHEGKGYATQAAQALFDYASSREEVRLVIAHTLPSGSASKRVLIKCGFRYVGDVVDPEDGTVSRFERAVGAQPNR